MMADDSGPHVYFSEASHLPSSSATSNPRPMDTWSVFGDDSCGEPLYPQHVVIDFTPNDDDSDIVQKKVCSFWRFINSHPEIQNLKVNPGECEVHTKSSNTFTPERKVVKPQPEEDAGDMEKTAWSMFEMVEEKEMITRLFEARMPHTVCSLGSFKEEEVSLQKKRAHQAPSKGTKPRKPFSVKKPASSAMKLCSKLREWDNKHPKSMDPPGHPASIQHCIIQRQIFES